jgi:hypothetical protein
MEEEVGMFWEVVGWRLGGERVRRGGGYVLGSGGEETVESERGR